MISENYRINYVCEEKYPITGSFYDNVGAVYSNIADEVSRTIYKSRVLAALTMDTEYIKDVIFTVEEARKFYTDLSKQKKIYIYGAGIMGERIVRYFPNIKWTGYIDQFSNKKELNGLPVINTDEYVYTEGDFIVVSVIYDYLKIEKTLMDKRIPKKCILSRQRIDDELYKKQYFDEEIVKTFEKGKAFVDCGCYDGSDCLKFMEYSKDGENARIYAFEPDSESFNICKARLQKYPNIIIYEAAVGNYDGSGAISKHEKMARINDIQGETVRKLG